MRRATEWRSEYSDMSMRTMARSSSKRKSARDLASSVLPTPVGPRKRNEPVGRLGSLIPARARRTASETAATAFFWPISRSPSTCSMFGSFGLGGGVQFPFQGGDLAVEDPGCGLQVPLALGLVRGGAELVKLGPQIAHPVQARLLGLPPGVQARELFLLVRHVRAQGREPFHRGGIGLAGQGQFLHGQAVHLA